VYELELKLYFDAFLGEMYFWTVKKLAAREIFLEN
jgi:hypothetical protein